MADRSNLASFYDPDHPDNRLMPVTGEREYWVEVRCDDGEQHGWGGWAWSVDDAEDKAWDDAVFWQKKPVEIDSCEVM